MYSKNFSQHNCSKIRTGHFQHLEMLFLKYSGCLYRKVWPSLWYKTLKRRSRERWKPFKKRQQTNVPGIWDEDLLWNSEHLSTTEQHCEVCASCSAGLSIGLLVCGWVGVLPVSDTQVLEFSF